MIRTRIAALLIAGSALGVQGCVTGELKCEGKVSTNFTGSQSDASAQYDTAKFIVSDIDRATVINNLKAGSTSGSAFVRFALTNAKMASSSGSAIVELVNSNTSVASISAPYHVSGNYLVFDDSTLVDQWLLATQSQTANLIRVSVTDIKLDTGTAQTSVTVEMAAVNGGTEYATVRSSYISNGDTIPTYCPKCVYR